MQTQPSSNMVRQIGISVAVIAVLGFAGFMLTRKARSIPNETPAVPLSDAITISDQGKSIAKIETATVRVETIAGDIKAAGQIVYSADQTVKISPRLQGCVQQVLVRVGDHVTAGQTLAVLDSVDAAAAQTTARQNDNKLRLATTNLERQERLYKLGTPDVTAAQASLDQAAARTQFTKEALERLKEQANIGGFTQKPLEDAQAAVVSANSDLAQAQSDRAQAERDYERKAKLVEIGVASKSDLEAALNVREKAAVTVQADQEKATLTKQALEREQKAFKTGLYANQQVRSAESDYRQAQLQEEAANRALRLAKTQILRDLQQARSDYQAARADAENAHRVLDILGHPSADGSVRILAPISGVVTDRQVSPGQIVDQSQMTPWQMFTLSNTDTVWVEADVYEKDISTITPGRPVHIHVGAFPGRESSGTIRRIAPTLDKTTRTIKVRAEIANREGLLKDGMYAEVIISSGKGRPALVVPDAAVQHDGDSDYAYVAQNGHYRRQKLQLGPHLHNSYIITGGLREGDVIVTHGAIFLDNQGSGS